MWKHAFTFVAFVLFFSVPTLCQLTFTITPPLGAEMVVGIQQTYTVTVNAGAPDVSLLFSPTSAYTVSPSELDFSQTTQTLNFTFTAITAGFELVQCTLSGTYATLYTAPSTYKFIVMRSLDFSASYSSFPTYSPVLEIPTNPFALGLSTPPTNPLTVFVGSDPAGALTFSATSFSFTSTTVQPYQFTYDAATTGNGGDVIIYFFFSGADSAWYQDQNYTITPQLRQVVPSTAYTAAAPVTVGQQTQAIRLSLNYPPPTGVTLTPYSNSINFAPPSLAFTPTTDNAQFSYTASIVGVQVISWTLSGPDAALYANLPNQSIFVEARSFVVVGPNTYQYGVGQTSNLFTVSTQYPPASGVTVTVTATSSCTNGQPTLTSSVLSFSSTVLQNTFAVSSSVLCSSVALSATLSGTDAASYTAPVFPNALSFGKLLLLPIANTDPKFTGVLHCGDTTSYTQSVSSPPPNGFSVTLTAPGATFMPSTLVFSPTVLIVPFTVTATYEQAQILVSYTVSGTDALLVAPEITNPPINVGLKTVSTPYAYSFITAGSYALYANTTSTLLPITLSNPPASDLTVTPSATGITFSPTSLVFTANTTSLFFSATAEAAGTYTTTYTLSGTDAGCYSITTATTVSIAVVNAFIQISPSYIAQLTVGTWSPSYTISISNLAGDVTITPVAEDANNNPVADVYSFDPPSISLTPQSPSASFTYMVSVVRPTSDLIVFEVSGDAAASINPLTVAVGQAELRTFTTPAYLYSSTILGVIQPAILVQGITSPSYIVSVADAPPTGVSLVPFAANTIFSPDELQFTSDTTSVSFTVESTLGTGINVGGGTTNQIVWSVQGTDAALYATPNPNSFVSVKRNLVVSQSGSLTSSSVYVNTPLSFTILTPYPPESTLTITISAGTSITLSPSSITLDPSTTAAVFTATPTAVGNNMPITFVISGDPNVVSEYVTIADVYVSAKQAGFSVTLPTASTNPESLVYGEESLVFTIRPQTSPPDSVTINIYSSQVTIDPSSYTYTPGDVSHDFYVEPILSAFPPNVQSNVAFTFVVSGTDSDLYTAPADVNFAAILSNPLRTLTVTPNYIYLADGQPTYFTVTSGIPPINGITITPSTPWENNYAFSPSSVTLTSTSSTATISVTMITPTLPINADLPIVFGISGPDAYLYSDPGTTYIYLSPSYGQISTPALADGTNLVVNQALAVPVTLNLAPTAQLSITPTVVSGQPITFTPAVITFTPGQIASTFSVTAQGVGSSRIAFLLSGAGATSYEPKSYVDVTLSAGTVTFSNNWAFNLGGQVKKGIVTLNTPTLNGLTVTVFGAGLVFSPSVISFAPGDVTATFSVTISASGISGYITSALGGPDAGLYVNPYPITDTYYYSSGAGTVSAYSSSNSGTYLQQTVTFYLSTAAQVTPLTISPYGPPGSNLTFSPASVTISDSVTTTASVSVISPTAGPVNVYYVLSGLGASYFTVANNLYADPVTLTFYAYSISVTSTGSTSIVVGVPSAPFLISTPAPIAPIGTVYITPSASISGIDFLPPSFFVNSTSPTATFAYRSNVTLGSFDISFALSGPGAASFLPIPSIAVTASTSTFTLPTYDNNYVTPTGAAFMYGVQSQNYVLFARSVPAEVWIQLQSTSLSFSPSLLHLTPANQQATFSFTPTAVGTAIITYNLVGNNTALFTAPTASTLFVTYQVTFPQIPTLSVGQTGGPYPVHIQPAPTSTFVLALAATSSIVFSPKQLAFTPGVTTQGFFVTGLAPTIYRPAYTLPGTAPPGPPGSSTVSLTGSDAIDGATRTIPLLQSSAIIIAPGMFTILHPRYQLDVNASITITISVQPRSDVILTLLANNINFDSGAYVVFTRGGPTTQKLNVIPRHTTSYELDYASFKVDYVLSGTNAGDYFAPSETLHYIALPMGYIAAIILVPIAIVVIIVIIIIVVKKRGGDSSQRT